MVAVFRHQEDVVAISEEWITRLKENARAEPLRRARLNLHRDDGDAVHEMLIALCDDTLVPPHRHAGKSESFHVIEGEVLVVVFDDAGKVIRKLHLGPPGTGRDFMYRQSHPVWHAVIPLTEVVVIHETTKGPFDKSDTEFPPWAPRENGELRVFLNRLK